MGNKNKNLSNELVVVKSADFAKVIVWIKFQFYNDKNGYFQIKPNSEFRNKSPISISES